MKHANPMRLNNSFFKDDLKKSLLDGIFSGGDYFTDDIMKWIDNYDKGIEESEKKILQLCREKVPNRYVTINPSPDGDISTFIVNIYGVRDDEEYKRNHNIMYDFVSKLEDDFLDGDFIFLIHNVSLKDTVEFYKTEMNELIKMGQTTKEECEKIKLEPKKETKTRKRK